MMPLQSENKLQAIYASLTKNKLITPSQQDSENYQWLSCMLASWCVGKSALPDYLGLEPEAFEKLLSRYFPECNILPIAPSGIEADFDRMLEKEDLIKLLRAYTLPDNKEAEWMIAIIVAGSLGNDHLWQDLGLWNRSQLSAMLEYNFPELAAKNAYDMKWKKFIYKQLCEAEGLYLCRAPSCNVCTDYQNCYGSEE